MTSGAHATHRRYGWRPSLPDPRDLHADVAGLAIADEVDPRDRMPPIFDQGKLGSCTANAVAAAIEYDRILDNGDYGAPSRLFIYYCERKLEGTLDQGDCGAVGRDGFKAAQKFGAPPEADWPYRIAEFAVDPPTSAWTDAEQYKLTKKYAIVPREQDAVKRVLTNDQTIAFGFTVFESFESAEVARTGVMPVPGPGEKPLGGHEVLAVGYLKSHPDHLLCRNSWGTDWGMHGYFLMPWEVVLNHTAAHDFRTIRRG